MSLFNHQSWQNNNEKTRWSREGASSTALPSIWYARCEQHGLLASTLRCLFRRVCSF